MSNEQIISFIPMAERYPDFYEVCLLLVYNNMLSVGCWISVDDDNRDGYFQLGSYGEYEKDEVIAWAPVDNIRLSKGETISFHYE